jgi:hypothetical protein
MLKPGEQPDLPDEAKLTGLGLRVRVQYLERNAAVVPGITGEINGRESSLADLALDLVSVGEGDTEGSKRVLRDRRRRQISLRPGIGSPVHRIENESLQDLNASLTHVRPAQT